MKFVFKKKQWAITHNFTCKRLRDQTIVYKNEIICLNKQIKTFV